MTTDSYTIRVECPGSTQCTEDAELACDTPHNDTTVGGHSRFLEYDCWPFLQETGPDTIHPFTATTSGPHRAEITGMSPDLDIFVLSDLDNCSGNTCIDSGDLDVTFNATMGQTYYIIVDGWGGDEDDYSLEINCP